MHLGISLALRSPSGTAVVPDKVVKKFWIEVDVDNSGLINFAEFCAWCHGLCRLDIVGSRPVRARSSLVSARFGWVLVRLSV